MWIGDYEDYDRAFNYSMLEKYYKAQNYSTLKEF